MNPLPASRLAKRHRLAAFTILEVMLAIVITTGLLATAMYFYQQSARLRNDLLEETERIGSARLIASLPSQASWQIPTEATPPGYPETGYRLVRYELLKKPLLEGSLDNEANQQMIDQVVLEPGQQAGDTNAVLASLMQGDAINRTVRRLLSAKTSTNDIGTVRIDPVLITDRLKHLKFRYLNAGAWVDAWPGPQLPLGIEVSLGIEPMSATNLLDEYTNHVFRRIIRIPAAAAPRATPRSNNLPGDTAASP